MISIVTKLFEKSKSLPSFIWVIILPLLLVGFIGSIIFLFWALATVEGFASIIMLIAGFFSLRFSSWLASSNFELQRKSKNTATGLLIAGAISFYALMGVAIDQPGNYFYNKPLEIAFCEDDSQLKRSVDVLHPLPGRTDIIQDFSCYDNDNNFVDRIGIFELIAGRFVEYVIIGYVLLYINKFINYQKLKKQHTHDLIQK